MALLVVDVNSISQFVIAAECNLFANVSAMRDLGAVWPTNASAYRPLSACRTSTNHGHVIGCRAYIFITPPSIGERSIAMSVSVCLSVCAFCLSAIMSSELHVR